MLLVYIRGAQLKFNGGPWLLAKTWMFLHIQGAQAKMANEKICVKFNICKQTSQFMKFFVEKRLMLSLNPHLVFKTQN